MIKAFGPKRSKGFRDKYLAPAMIVAALFFGGAVQAQTVPTIDSIHRWVNAKVTNTVLTAFSNRDLNRILHAILFRIDSASGGGGSVGVDQVQILNDSSFRYRLNGVYSSPLSLKGVYDNRTKVEKVYEADDSTLAVVSNGPLGPDTTLITKGGGSAAGTEALDAASMVRANSKLYSKNPVFTSLASVRSITTADLNTGFIYRTNINGVLGEWYYDAADATTADDTAMTIVTSSGKRLKRLHNGTLNPKWFGATGDGVTDDWQALQSMFNYIDNATAPPLNIVFPAGTYLVSDSLYLPASISGLAAYPWLHIDGAGATIKTTSPISIFYRLPTDMTQSNSYRDGYKAIIENLYFEGDGDVNSKGIEIGSTYGWVFRNLHFLNVDVGFYSAFSLENTYNNLFFTLCKTEAFYGDFGHWTGATPSNTSFNANEMRNIRVYCSSGQAYGFHFTGDGNLLEKIIIEGNKPVTGIYFDSDLSSVTNLNTVRQVWFEANGGSVTKSVNFKLKIVGDFTVSDIQNPYADTLVDWTGSASSCNLYIDKLAYVESPTVLFKGGTIAGMKLIFGRGIMNDVFDFTSTSYYAGSARPPIVEQPFATAAVGSVIKSSSDISVIPGSNSSNQRINLWGTTLFKNDNLHELGGLGGSFNFRPNVGYFGTNGLYVDVNGRYRFGSATVTPDVTLGRDALGWLGVYDNAFSYKNFKADSILTNSRSGYTSAFSLASMGDNDWITKQQATDLVAESAANIDFDPYWFTGTGVDPDFKTLDSTKFTTTYRGDTLHIRDSLLQVQIAALVGSGVDSVTKVADSFRVWKSGVYTALKDSIGAGGAGIPNVNRDGTLTGNGDDIPLGVDTTPNKIASQYMIKTYSVTAGVGISITVTTDANGNKTYQITNGGSPNSNPLNALDLRSYGAQMDATIPGSGSTPNGTDNTPFLQSAINAAADGQWIIIPPGSGSGVGYAFKTALDTIKGPKRVYLLFLADVYLANNDFIRVRNGSGDYEQHKIIFEGNVFGRVNQASHSKSTFDAGTGPVWSTYTNVVVKLIDVNQSYVQFNRVTGTKAPCEIIGGVTANAGAQENTVIGRRFPSNRYGILLTSYDGTSYTDKNYFGGPEGGTLRIGGNIPLFIDGFAGSVDRGDGVFETNNGAARSNEFHFLIENADSLPVVQADATENWFDIMQEGGGSTGVLSATATWHMKSSGANFVRSPRYTWKGVYNANRFGTGSTAEMGVDGTFKGAIWSQNSTAYYGNEGVIDGSGNVVIKAKESISNSTRSGAPAYIKFVNDPTYQPQDVVSITASSYTVAAGVRVVKYNNAAGTATLPSPSTYPTRRITIMNLNGNPLDISGTLGTGVVARILGFSSTVFFSDGAAWYNEGGGEQKYTLAYTSTSSTSVTASSSGSAQSLIGGSKTLTAVNAGDIIELSGSGSWSLGVSAATPSIDFVVGSQTIHVGLASNFSAFSTGTYKYHFKATPTTTGSNVATYIEYQVDFYNASADVLKPLPSMVSSNALTTATPSVNVIGYFNNSGNTMTTYTNMIEVKRK